MSAVSMSDQRMEGQGNQVSNGPQDHVNESDDFESLRTCHQPARSLSQSFTVSSGSLHACIASSGRGRSSPTCILLTGLRTAILVRPGGCERGGCERHPERHLPYHSSFADIARRLRETGSFARRGGGGRPRSVRTPTFEEDVLRRVAGNQSASTRGIAHAMEYTLGVNAWRRWVLTKNSELEKAATSNRKLKLFKPEILQQTADELNYSLCLFVKEVRKPDGQEYAPDTIYYLCLGYIVTRVEEEHLWESKQLGAHSPHVLLSTLMFFNTKYFNLVTVEEHMQLSFSHIMKPWKRNPTSAANKTSSRNVLLRYYPPQAALEANPRKKKVYEQSENEANPLRCPVKLYEFYMSKCPESVKTRNDVFYLLPERSCVPDSPVWYSTMALGKEPLMKMLHRVKMVKEINQALLKS